MVAGGGAAAALFRETATDVPSDTSLEAATTVALVDFEHVGAAVVTDDEDDFFLASLGTDDTFDAVAFGGVGVAFFTAPALLVERGGIFFGVADDDTNCLRVCVFLSAVF